MIETLTDEAGDDIDDDVLDDEPAPMFAHRRPLMEGEAVPSAPTLYQLLAMTWRGGNWSLRE